MANRKISASERFGIWSAWGGKCLWCGEPILFPDCHIDHIIPIDAVNTPEKERMVRSEYALDAAFEFNSFANWAPAHPGCNQAKRQTLLRNSPAFALALERASEKAVGAAMAAEGIERDRSASRALAIVEKALSQGDVTEEDIRKLFSKVPVKIRKGDWVSLKVIETLQVAPDWIVTTADGDVLKIEAKFPS